MGRIKKWIQNLEKYVRIYGGNMVIWWQYGYILYGDYIKNKLVNFKRNKFTLF